MLLVRLWLCLSSWSGPGRALGRLGNCGCTPIAIPLPVQRPGARGGELQGDPETWDPFLLVCLEVPQNLILLRDRLRATPRIPTTSPRGSESRSPSQAPSKLWYVPGEPRFPPGRGSRVWPDAGGGRRRPPLGVTARPARTCPARTARPARPRERNPCWEETPWRGEHLRGDRGGVLPASGGTQKPVRDEGAGPPWRECGARVARGGGGGTRGGSGLLALACSLAPAPVPPPPPPPPGGSPGLATAPLARSPPARPPWSMPTAVRDAGSARLGCPWVSLRPAHHPRSGLSSLETRPGWTPPNWGV